MPDPTGKLQTIHDTGVDHDPVALSGKPSFHDGSLHGHPLARC